MLDRVTEEYWNIIGNLGSFNELLGKIGDDRHR